MTEKVQKLTIDSSLGGNGDIWMRLVGLYTVAGLRPDLKIHILLQPMFMNIADAVFGERLVFINKNDYKSSSGLLVYTSLGLVSLLKGIMGGTKYISPYQRAVVHDKKKKGIKDFVNNRIFDLADFLGIVQVPASRYIKVYQGYLDIIAIKRLRNINYEQFIGQLKTDYNFIFFKMNSAIPISKELTIPDDLFKNTIIFPTGTGRQFVPVLWAKEHLPNAYYAFYFRDQDATVFRENGLKTVFFYKEPGDIIKLSNSAKWTITTDSFPSHLLQYASKRCTVTITEVLRSRIISPVFKGKVVDSEVPCHPCLHLDRTNNPYCSAGHKECLNWKNKLYINNIIKSAG